MRSTRFPALAPLVALVAALVVGTLTSTPAVGQTAGSSLAPTSGAPRPDAPAPLARYTPGMDVSHWQGNINWGQVGNGQIRFSLTRASHGYEEDTEYVDNRIGASEEGIFFGAYHYAVPKGTTKEAVRQADFFLDLATPQSGDILPVLDMEASGGKSPKRLIEWVNAFLRRVENRVDVKAIIYTSPSFWETAMSNTKRFARRGHPLWIANWEVQRPRVPAGNWAGRGWTFWQWTDCRSVNGINGCVDGNRYIRTNLGKVTIP